MSLDFDGSNDVLDLGNPSVLDITGTTLTLACWFKHDTAARNDMLIAKWGSVSLFQYRLWISSADQITVSAGNGAGTQQGISATTVISTATWYHACGRLSSSGAGGLHVFTNGTDENNTTGISMGSNGVNVGIGKALSGSAFPMDGKIAEACIWNVALTDEQIRSLSRGVSPFQVRPSGLKYYCPLWSSAHIRDISSSAILGTLTEAVTAAHAPVAPLVSVPQTSPYRVTVSAAGRRKLMLGGVS